MALGDDEQVVAGEDEGEERVGVAGLGCPEPSGEGMANGFAHALVESDGEAAAGLFGSAAEFPAEAGEGLVSFEEFREQAAKPVDVGFDDGEIGIGIGEDEVVEVLGEGTPFEGDVLKRFAALAVVELLADKALPTAECAAIARLCFVVGEFGPMVGGQKRLDAARGEKREGGEGGGAGFGVLTGADALFDAPQCGIVVGI
jgi:hypothetical protein